MTHVFRETNQGLTCEHALIEGSPVVSFKTARAKVDILHTQRYGPMFFIDGCLQAAHFDEYIYHEFLVHPAMANSASVKRVCIFGGSDGCAAREVLKWKGVEQVNIVDWDKELVNYFQANGNLWHQGAWRDTRVYHIHKDISQLAEEQQVSKFDVILIDLLDPTFDDLQENGFWEKTLRLAKDMLNPGGAIVMNTGGVLPWKVSTFHEAVRKAADIFRDLKLQPYKIYVPSFLEEWTFILLHSNEDIDCSFSSVMTRRLTEKTFRRAMHWEREFQFKN
jgi:spermidine synthase